MNDNYPMGVRESDFMEDTSKPYYVYQNSLTTHQQKQVCLDFLEAKELHDSFEDWRTEKDYKGEWIDGVQEYCESQDSFWEWLEQ